MAYRRQYSAMKNKFPQFCLLITESLWTFVICRSDSF